MSPSDCPGFHCRSPRTACYRLLSTQPPYSLTPRISLPIAPDWLLSTVIRPASVFPDSIQLLLPGNSYGLSFPRFELHICVPRLPGVRKYKFTGPGEACNNISRTNPEARGGLKRHRVDEALVDTALCRRSLRRHNSCYRVTRGFRVALGAQGGPGEDKTHTRAPNIRS